MAYLLLALAQVAGILMIPFGLPGTWVQVAALGAYAYFTGFAIVGWVPLLVVVLLAAAAEVVEFLLGGSFARRYGGGRRAAWGAILGGLAGAVVGIPVPIVGSVVGGFVGSFVGAVLFQFSAERSLRPALRTGWGALLGRLAAVAVKSGVGVAVAAVALFTALR